MCHHTSCTAAHLLFIKVRLQKYITSCRLAGMHDLHASHTHCYFTFTVIPATVGTWPTLQRYSCADKAAMQTSVPKQQKGSKG